MAESGMFGTGGLMRYKEEYNSKFKIKPSVVIGLVVITVVLELLLHFFI